MVVSSGCDKLGDDVSDKRKERLKICFDRWIMKKNEILFLFFYFFYNTNTPKPTPASGLVNALVVINSLMRC